jgi:hypothetical protein
MVGQRTLNPYVGVRILRPQPEMQRERIVTPLTWALAPAWLDLEKACHLSGYDLDLLRFLIHDGGVDAKQDGDSWLIEKQSLLDFRECLALALNWAA